MTEAEAQVVLEALSIEAGPEEPTPNPLLHRHDADGARSPSISL